MTHDFVVMAAGLGTRLRPVTERWAKPALPIDGRPVIATLLHELAAAGARRVWLVTGHLAEQVEALAGDGSAFGLEVRPVRQERPDGSADAVQRALAAGAQPPFVLTAADTVYTHGDVGRFARSWEADAAVGAIAVRMPGPPHVLPIRVEDGRVKVVRDVGGEGPATPAPLMGVGEALVDDVEAACAPPFRVPYEVADAFQRAIDRGERIDAIEIGTTRDLTTALDLVEENFPYVRGF